MQDSSKRETLKIVIGFTISIVLLILAIFFGINGPRDKVYDCSIAEISPDYPQEVKDECRRRIRAKYI